MATYREGDEQFPDHTWKSDVDEYGGPIEKSSTSHGDFVVSGKGYGKMKWSATHSDSNWEVLGTTRGQVRAESNLHLKSLHQDKKKNPKEDK